MVVFLDVVLVENFVLDLLVLLAVGVCLRGGFRFWRVCLAALLGAVFYVLEFVVVWFTWIQWIISCLMVVVSFGFSGIKRFVWQVCLFYFVSFAFGGVSFGMMCLLNRNGFGVVDGAFVGNFNLIWVMLAAFMGFAWVVVVLKRKSRHVIEDVIISVGGRVVGVKVLLDTGNLLREPYGNRPVLIVEKRAVRDILDDGVWDSFHEVLSGELDLPVRYVFYSF